MEFIVSSTPNKIIKNKNIIKLIEYKIINNMPLSLNEVYTFLAYVIFMTRIKFSNNINNCAFTLKCDKAQSIICTYFNEIGIENYPCMTQNVITNNITGHSFITAIFNIKNNNIPFLIDPTYRQFFTKEKCTNENYLIINDTIIKSPDPGYFIKNKNEISYFLKKGYGILNTKLAKIYGDSFYKTKTGIPQNESLSNINGSIYINAFLKGNETLSINKEELIDKNLYLPLLNSYDLEKEKII